MIVQVSHRFICININLYQELHLLPRNSRGMEKVGTAPSGEDCTSTCHPSVAVLGSLSVAAV